MILETTYYNRKGDSVNKNVGQLLKELREKKKLSQNQLARKLHISRSVIAKYETGEREPSFNNLVILSKFFKIPITDLIPIYQNNIKSNNMKDVLNYLLKQNKSFRIAVLTLVIVLLMITTTAIIYINILNYVSTKVYRVTSVNHNSFIRDGLLVKTKDKIYLSLNTNADSKDITKLKFYYLDDEERVYIVETSEVSNLKFYADLNDDEFFSSHNYKNFIDHSFLEICYKDNSTKSIELEYEFDYTNNNLGKSNKITTTEKISEEEKDESNINAYVFKNIDNSKLYEVVMPFIKDNNYETFDVNLDGIKYRISIINNLLNISYNNYRFVYQVIDKNETLIYSKINNNEELYSYNITDDICSGPQCSRSTKDIKLIRKLITKLKK